MPRQRSARVPRAWLGILAASVVAATTMLSVLPAIAVVQVGQVAPDFTKTDLTGTTQTLSAYRGKIVVLFLLGYN